MVEEEWRIWKRWIEKQRGAMEGEDLLRVEKKGMVIGYGVFGWVKLDAVDL